MSTRTTKGKPQYLYVIARILIMLAIGVLFLWLAESCVVHIMDEMNAFCIKDLNEPAFVVIVVIAVLGYTGWLIKKRREVNYYISTRCLVWWLAGMMFYGYFRCFSDHYTFWGLDVCGWHIAYLDILALPTIVLGKIYIDCHRKRKENTTVYYTLDDDPIVNKEKDLFGYNIIALHLKEDLEHADISKHAYSVGITGAWGKGKSSFLNLFENAVKEDESSDDIVIRFYPRSSSSVSDIQEDFFQTFSNTIAKYHTNVNGLVRKYKLALRLSDSTGIIGKLLTMVCVVNAENEKERINKALQDINRRIFVIIEDLDRLTGKEIIEVLKLIDRNGDFCNVIYMSAYDKEYVNNVLNQELGHKAAGCFTDKYFNYEMPLPVQKTWVIKNYIANFLQNQSLLATKDPSFSKTLNKNWDNIGKIVARTLGNLRHAKRFLNLFMSRYIYVKDDVNVFDFLLLTLIRYSNIKVYDAIVKCLIVYRGGCLNGSRTTMYLFNDFEDKIKDFEVNNEIVSILKVLFPSKGEEQDGESEYKRIRRAESFDLYFYDKYDGKIYSKNIRPIFEDQLDDNALAVLESLIAVTANRDTIEEYLRYRGIDWIVSPDKLRRYIKLIILAYHETNRNFNYYASFSKMLYKSTADDFIKNNAIKDSNEYSAILYRSIDEMIERCSLSIGLKLTELLGDIKRAGENTSDLALSSDQLVDLSFKALQYYTEHSAPSTWSAMGTIKLSLIYTVGEKTIDNKAKEYIMEQLNSAPERYAAEMLQSIVQDQGNGKKLVLSLREIGVLKQVFNNWGTDFPLWIKKLSSEDEQFVFRALFEALKHNENIVVNALKDDYESNDYAGFREAIEKDKVGS